jgi:large subunit ribosomal protein L3
MQVVLTWTSKWRWFSWAMKRHNFHGWPATHGSKFHRALGSIGNRKPTRTHKGKKMHWHYGTDTVTLKKVPVELVNKELSVIGVRWGVPGARNSLVEIKFN